MICVGQDLIKRLPASCTST